MTSNNRRAAALALLLTAAGTARSLEASVARAVSFDQKVREADEIVVGRCTRVASSFDPSGRWIVTRATFEVEDGLKGSPGRELTVLTPGGVVGSLRQETVGIPRFQEGEEKLLFTKAVSGAERTVLFAEQGTYDVVGTGADRKIAPVMSRVILIDPETGAVRSDREPVRSLSDFHKRVAATLGSDTAAMKSNDMGVIHPGNGAAEATQELRMSDRVLLFVSNNGLVLGMLAIGVALASIPLIRRR